MITFETFDKYKYVNDVIVTDSLISSLYGITGDNVYILPRGERAKSQYHFFKLAKWMVERNVSKQSRVIAVGGGSVGDLAGFVASVYKRGIAVVNVPTTLLSMVDSAIGGKTAIDMCGVKNVLGSFIQCDTVIDVNFLKTLPKRQFDYAMGEVLKYRMLSAEIDQINGSVVDYVKPCALYKESVVAQDRLDAGVRRTLNLGHTVGHALELQYNLAHGKAVTWGLKYELDIAFSLGYASAEYRSKWQKNLVGKCPEITEETLRLMKFDKKNLDDKVVFVLPCDNHATKFFATNDLEGLFAEVKKCLR
ncbi:MAG TPA: 3-dehydroquinate synthase [Candidatus Limihabitans stercoravium]|nr:3-dehydroquinate synthase [Candidatus Limihabitans stercoravium]